MEVLKLCVAQACNLGIPMLQEELTRQEVDTHG